VALEVDIHRRLRIAVVGAGVMGANHARVIAEADDTDLHVIVDSDFARAERLAALFSSKAAGDLSAVEECDAAVVAVSTRSHRNVALPLIGREIPVLIEKPLAEEILEVRRILDTAQSAGVPLMCGFVERYNPALTTAIGLIELPVVHMSAVRHSPRNPAAMSSVVNDLLIHDIDLAVRLAGATESPVVSGATWAPEPGCQPEIAEWVLRFGGGMLANLSASRWGQRKIREVKIVTDQQLIEIDLLRITVTVYRNLRQEIMDGYGRYRADTIVEVPFVRHRGEPLALQLEAFCNLVRSGDPDLAGRERNSILLPHLIAGGLGT
jgi:predicted dehydrogenase